MAKVLDALARAQQERLRRQQGSPADSAEPQPADSFTPEEVADPAPVPVAAPQAPTLPPFTGDTGDIPAVHPNIADVVIGAHDVSSPIAEQVRQIRTNLESVLADYPSRSIVVTSPVSGDGKSLFSANLAWALADNVQQRVLLIDADMRKPDQYRLFGLRRAPGLSEYLRGQNTLDQTIHRTSLANFDIMTSGRPASKPTTLLTSDRLPAMIDQLRSRYTWILFDTPPILPVTDASLIGRLCAGLILVVRMGKTQRVVIERAQELIAENRLPVLGCVLNEYEPSGRAHDYYYRYYGKPDGGAK